METLTKSLATGRLSGRWLSTYAEAEIFSQELRVGSGRGIFEDLEDGVSVAYQRTQRSSLHPNVMELGRGGTKPGPYWSMRWLPAGPSHVRTTVKDDRAGVFRSPARLIDPVTAMEHLHSDVEPHIGGAVA